MSRKQLNEGNLVIDFVTAIFNAIVRQRNKALRKAAEEDPEFKRITAALQKSRDDLTAWAEQRSRESPSFARSLRMFNDLDK